MRVDANVFDHCWTLPVGPLSTCILGIFVNLVHPHIVCKISPHVMVLCDLINIASPRAASEALLFLVLFKYMYEYSPVAKVIHLFLAKSRAPHRRSVHAIREFGICEDTPTHLGKLPRRAGHPFASNVYPGRKITLDQQWRN